MIVGGSAHKSHGIGDVATIRGCINNQNYRRPSPVVAALVPLAHKMAKRRCDSIYDRGLEVRRRVINHQFQSEEEISHWPHCNIRRAHFWISTQERRSAVSKARHRATECISQVSTHWETGRERFNNPMCVVRRIQARHWVTDWHFARLHRESRSHRTRNVGLEGLPVECQRENNGVHRLPRDATSLKIPVPKHRETDYCSQR